MGDTPAVESDAFAAFVAARPGNDELELARLDAEVGARLFGRGAARPRVGRYTLVERLGTGGMGEVWSAHDPVLDRHVALKLLHAQGSADVQQRVLAEAQAIARLSHPNVVAVYEVGLDDDHLYLAMELVVGMRLDRWLRVPRTSAGILAAFVAAGRGLAAAHAAGLVHRDFKPANALVGDDGRVRVLDFGLACAPVDAAELAHQAAGTPAYMAPEQHAGAGVTAQADVYALCVALTEALAGALPFAGATAPELARAKRDDPGETVARRLAHEPAWLRRVLARGLAVDPRDRPDMATLIDVLEHTPRRHRRRVGVAGVGVALAGAVWLGATIEGERGSQCDTAGDAVQQLWHADRRSEIVAALASAPLRSSAEIAETAAQRLDRYAEALAHARVEVCGLSLRARDGVAQARGRCLEARSRELAATLEILAQAERGTAARALEIVGRLEDPDDCSDAAAWSAESAAAVDVADELARARAWMAAARFDEARALVARAGEAATRLDDRRLLARAQQLEGVLARKLGEPEAAEHALRAALLSARHAQDTVQETRTAISLAEVIGHVQGRTAEGLWFADLAEASLVGRVVEPSLRSALSAARGEIHLRERSAAAAMQRFAAALALVDDDPDYHDRPYLLQRYGDAATEAGDLVVAEVYLNAAIVVGTRMFGPEHPLVAWARNNLGGVLLHRGHLDAAEAMLADALAIRRAVWGDRHAEIAASLNNLAAVLTTRGRHDAAAPLLREALGMIESIYGRDHHKSAAYRGNLGELLVELGDYDGARGLLEATLSDRRRLLGPTHPDVATSLLGLARLANRVGDHATALARLSALALEFPEVPAGMATDIAIERARVQRSSGDDPLALATLREALAHEPLPLRRADLELELARALGHDPTAREHARRAQQVFRAAGIGGARGRDADALAD